MSAFLDFPLTGKHSAWVAVDAPSRVAPSFVRSHCAGRCSCDLPNCSANCGHLHRDEVRAAAATTTTEVWPLRESGARRG